MHDLSPYSVFHPQKKMKFDCLADRAYPAHAWNLHQPYNATLEPAFMLPQIVFCRYLIG
jgi:hypothetical protein